MRRCRVGLLLALVGCQAPLGRSRSAITNGMLDSGDPAVVALVLRDGNVPHCTGTLIGPHTVLTAAHCMIDRTNFDGYRVFFGASVADGGTFADVTDAVIDPAFDPASLASDVALVTIRQTPPAAPVARDPRAIDASFVGQSFQVVGFGVTTPTAQDAGIKRTGTAQMSAVGSVDFTAGPAPSQPCAIDSGGPALFVAGGTTYVSGVVSHGDAACSDHAVFARIDVAAQSFIDPYLAATAPLTAGTGDRCFYDDQCRGGPCLQTADEPRLSFCSRPCASRADCPSAMICASDGCRYPVPSPGAVGSPCSQASQCASGMCSSDGVCTRHCNPVGLDCPNGLVCQRTSGTDYLCVLQPSDAGCQCAAMGRAGDAPAALIVIALIVAGRTRTRRAASPARSRAR